jgi:hypothetical protein
MKGRFVVAIASFEVGENGSGFHGVLTVTVYDQMNSDHRMIVVNVGDHIRVRGMVFLTSGGQANM